MDYCTQNKVEAFADSATLLESICGITLFHFKLGAKGYICALMLLPKWKVLT